MDIEQEARMILGDARGIVIDDVTAQDSQYRLELNLIRSGIVAALKHCVKLVPTAMECEDAAMRWAEFTQVRRREAQDFYEGAHHVHAEVFHNLRKLVDGIK